MYNNKKISAIVAVGKNFEIGYKNNLLCYISEDLKRFKKITTGNVVIMGRKTFESLPKGALPNRQNIVITRNDNLTFENCTMANSIENAIEKADSNKEIFIIGGEQIYKKAMQYIDKLYLTKIFESFDNADAFFPEINFDDWEITEESDIFLTDKCDYQFQTLLRKK